MTTWPPPQPPREALPESEREAYDRVVDRQEAKWGAGRGAGPYFGALLQSPPVCDAINELGRVMRTRAEGGDTFSHADREWVDMVLGLELGCLAVLYGHIPDAVAVGVRPEAIRALWERREDDLSARERLLAAYIRAVAGGTVDERLFGRLEAELGTRGAVDYTACITWLQLTMRTMQALGAASRPIADAEIAERIAGFVDGTAEVPDPAARIA